MIDVIESEIGNRHIEMYSEKNDATQIIEQILAVILGWA